jgi:uncharacterized protein YjbJ (UPF0337 family)
VKQFADHAQENWSRLTDDDMTVIARKRDRLARTLRERYGYGKDDVEKQLVSFSTALKLKL